MWSQNRLLTTLEAQSAVETWASSAKFLKLVSFTDHQLENGKSQGQLQQGVQAWFWVLEPEVCKIGSGENVYLLMCGSTSFAICGLSTPC